VYKKKLSRYRPGISEGWGSRISRQSAHEGGQVVSPTHRPSLPPERIPDTHFCYRLSRPQGHNATGRIKSLKNSSGSIGNRTRDLPVCSAVPQPTEKVVEALGLIRLRPSVCLVTNETHTKRHSGQSATRPTFDPTTSWIQISSRYPFSQLALSCKPVPSPTRNFSLASVL
jgi:hypothetical protein